MSEPMHMYRLTRGNHREFIVDKDKPGPKVAGKVVKLNVGDKIEMTARRAASLKDRFELVGPEPSKLAKSIKK